MLKWSERSKPGIRRLFENYQDIDVYVEDEGDEAFYSKLLKRLTKDHLRIQRVYALKGRLSVIEKCRSHDFLRRKALFIIDGDIEFTKGFPPPLDSPYLHRLDSYCIENKIICKNATKKIILEETDADIDNAEEILDFDTWINRVRDSLPDLFAAYATLHNFSPSSRTVGNGVGQFLKQDGKKHLLCTAKVDMVKQTTLDSALQHAARSEVESFLTSTKLHIASLTDSLDCVSGKDFLLPLLRFHLDSKECRIHTSSLRRRLSMNCDTEPFRNLLNHMKQIVAYNN